ncbi:MAG: FG-GAP repeat protein, partial [Thermoplasmata archaeon]|nr:FG-GAP repeat protein [Thermoplasmata archaeon]
MTIDKILRRKSINTFKNYFIIIGFTLLLTNSIASNIHGAEINGNNFRNINDGQPDIIIDKWGEAADFGISMSTRGDLNGDGIKDLLVGTYSGTDKVYVYFGDSNFDNSSDIVIEEQTEYGFFGWALASGGDLNNDNYDDLAVSLYNENKVYIYFGGTNFDGTVDLIIDAFAYKLDCSGDINNDGIDDLALALHRYVYIYLGGNNFDGIFDFLIDYGSDVSIGGDVNGDEIDDVVTISKDDASVYFGGNNFDNISDVSFSDYNPMGYYHYSVDSSGDLNDDGYCDIVFGVVDDSKAYIYFGGPNLDNQCDYIIDSYTDDPDFGISISNIGDVNGDWISDLIISSIGEVYLFYGSSNFDITPDKVYYLEDSPITAWYGYAIDSGGDLNDDGVDDIAISARGGCSVYIYFGVWKNSQPSLTKDMPNSYNFDEDTGDGSHLIDLFDYFNDDRKRQLRFEMIFKEDDTVLDALTDNHFINFVQKKPNWFGTLKFQVKAIDNGDDGVQGNDDDLFCISNFFNVTVNPTNDPPIINDIGGKIIKNHFIELNLNEDVHFKVNINVTEYDNEGCVFGTNISLSNFHLDQNRGNVSFLPTNENVGIIYGNISVTDENQTSDTVNITLLINNANDVPLKPIINLPVNNSIWNTNDLIGFNGTCDDPD